MFVCNRIRRRRCRRSDETAAEYYNGQQILRLVCLQLLVDSTGGNDRQSLRRHGDRAGDPGC